MDTKPGRSAWALPVVIGLVALLIGAGIGWFARSGEIAELTGQLAEARSAAEEPSEEPPGEPTIDPATSDTPAEKPVVDPAAGESAVTDPPATASGREFCYVREVVNETGTTMITVDYAQFLTGADAAAAATARGDESPPPNDYYIVNENPLLRTFPVRAGITVTLHHGNPSGNMEPYTVVLGQWQDFFVGMSPGMEVVRDIPYWITLKNGEVTAIEELYLP